MATVSAGLYALRQPSGASRLWRWAALAMALVALVAGGAFLKRFVDARNRPELRQITWEGPETRLDAAAISPSARYTAYANAEGIFVRTGASTDTRGLPAPPGFRIDHLGWLPDESGLIASGVARQNGLESIWLVSTGGDPPKRLRERGRLGIPSPDGHAIAYIDSTWSQVWTANADGSDARMVLSGGNSVSFSTITWLCGGRYLGVQREFSQTVVRPDTPSAVHDFITVEPAAGKTVGRAPGMWISSPAPTKDGRLIFLRNYFDATQYLQQDEMWEARVDPRTGGLSPPVLVAQLQNPQNAYEHVRDLSVSSDGRHVVLRKITDAYSIFVGDFHPNPPAITNVSRAAFDSRSSYPHSWSMNGDAIIFESNRNGQYDIFKLPLVTRLREPLAVSGELKYMPQATPDGRWVMFSVLKPLSEEERAKKLRRQHHSELFRVPIGGGPMEPVPIGGYLDEFRCGARSGSRCVLREKVANEFVFSELEPVSGKGRELARTAAEETILGDWALSPDGTRVAIPIHSKREARIHVVTLNAHRNGAHEFDVTIPGLKQLGGLHWSTAIEGWFATTESAASRQLFVHPDGAFHVLGAIQGWLVPSPDGKHVAFSDSNVASNAWIMTRR